MKQLIIILGFLISGFGYSQSGETAYLKEPRSLDVVFSPGIFIQKEIFTEANILLGTVYNNQSGYIPMVGATGFRVGIETNLKSNENFIIAPKLGYEISVTYFSIRLSALNYFQNKQSEFRLLPEAGISIGGLINLTYGYGIGFGQTIHGISNHRLSLSFNLNKRLWNAVIKGLDPD